MSDSFTGPLPPARFNMAEYCLANAAKNTPDKVGLVVLNGIGSSTDNDIWTYGQLQQAVLANSSSLRTEGLLSGDRILIRLGNTIDYALLFFGALAMGAIPIPASSMLTDREADTIMADATVQAFAVELHEKLLESRSVLTTDLRKKFKDYDDTPTHLFVFPDSTNDERKYWRGIRRFTTEEVHKFKQRSPLTDYADTSADDPAFLIYTSGTTGKPKGVLHAHRSAWGRRPMYRDWYGIASDDRVLHAGAFNWTYTLGTGLTDPWANGATAIINTQPRDPSRWPGLIRDTNATIFAAVPSLYRQILKYSPSGPIDLGDLRHGLTAGETLPASVATEWFERTGTRLHEALGMSEMSTYISASPEQPAKPGTIGKTQSGRCIAILPTDGGTVPLPTNEIGMLAVHRSDPGLMIDYWKRPDESEKVFRGDWFIGGDLASIDENGYVTHHGRADDLMNAFGYRVSPQEVEQVLASTPGVSEIAVTDIAVREDLRIVAAFVVAQSEADDPIPALQTRANAELAEYKRPRDYFLVDSLPRTPNGKIRRSDLQSIYDNRNTPS